MPLPTLVIVSGPAGSGKTTLAHRLAATIGCPALCRDELKEGMVAATPGFVPGPSDPLTVRSYGLFFAAIGLFLEHGVTHVAEAAFQHTNWARGLEPRLSPVAWWAFEGFSMPSRRLRLRRLSHYCWSV
jgi:predicted kinase